MSPTTQTAETALAPEERERGDVYALLSRLFAAPADEALLASIAASDQSIEQRTQESIGEFLQAWRDLVTAANDVRQTAAADEYHELFVGAGRPQVSLYLGAYTARSLVDTPLVALRRFLASHGLQRQSGVHEPEDHFAMLLEIMRFLICEERAALDEQKQFFDKFIWSGGMSLCDAISEQSAAHFYRSVAFFTKQFLFIEHSAFGM